MHDKSATELLLTERTGREVRDLLRELYVDKRWSQQEIADELHVSRTAVVAWCAKYGISRADRRTEPVA